MNVSSKHGRASRGAGRSATTSPIASKLDVEVEAPKTAVKHNVTVAALNKLWNDHYHIRVPEPNEINDVNASPNFATDHHSLSPPHIGCFMTSTYRPIPSAQGRIHSSLRCLHAMLCHVLRVRASLRFSPSTP